jgi:SNF2 family DNA or RNA helicase
LLQGGPWEPFFKDCNRVRREFTHNRKTQAARLEERYKTGRVRVVSVSFEKLRHPVAVYNVEVSNTPHYFAEGILTHNCKNVNSMTYRMCRAISKEVPWAFGLTGTPFGKQLEDLWAQFFLIDHGETLGPTLGLFRSAFFAETTNYWGGWEYKFKKTMMPVLEKVIKHRSIRFKIEECHDMPKKSMVKKFISPTQDVATYYNKIVESMNNLSFGKIKFRELESQAMRLRQLASGFMTLRGDDDSKAQVKFPNNPKLDMLEEIIEGMPEDSKVIIFHDFRYTNGLISERLKKMKFPHARVWGGGKNNLAEIRKFKKDPKCRGLVINTQSGSSSQNLQVANYVVYFEQPRSSIDRQQSERRAWRPGQLKHVFFFDLLMKGTVDEKQYDSNVEGRNLLKALLDGSLKIKKLLL